MALTNKDARIVLGMVERGDKRHDIAAWFGENQARIAEVEAGDFGSISAASPSELPPKGAPGVKGRRLLASVKKAVANLEDGDAEKALENLKTGIARFNQNEA